MKHTNDFDNIIADAIEDAVWVNENGSQAGHDLFTRPRHEGPLQKGFAGLCDFIEKFICNFLRGHACVVTPNFVEISLCSRRPNNALSFFGMLFAGLPDDVPYIELFAAPRVKLAEAERDFGAQLLQRFNTLQ